MPRRAADNEIIRTAQRARLLDAAAHVFVRKGLSATRIEDVAKQAGVSHGLVHHYFESKAGLHRALLERIMASADALPRAAQQRPGTAWERIAWLVETALLGARQLPEQFSFVAEALTNEAVEEDVRRHAAAQGQKGVNLLGGLIAQGQAEGTVRRGDPRVLAEHVFATVQGLAIARVGERIDPDVVLGLLRISKEES